MRPSFLRVALASALAVVLSVGFGACSRPNGPVARYQVRAEILSLPEGPGGELLIRHEAIDGFADRDGKKVGMDPMSMPFPVAEGLSFAGLAAGDVVRATLEVDWQQRSPAKITAIEKLPAGTQLTFRAAHP